MPLADLVRALLAHCVRVKARVNRRVHHIAHTGEHAFHYAYLGLVTIESHGFYGKAAGGMLVCLALVDIFKGD